MVEEGHRSLAGLVLGGCGICRHRRKRQTVYRVALETAKPVPTATAARTTTGGLKNDGEPALASAVGSQVEQCYARSDVLERCRADPSRQRLRRSCGHWQFRRRRSVPASGPSRRDHL